MNPVFLAEKVNFFIVNEGLSRQTAVLTAFEHCFPVDFRECKRLIEGNPDGENELYKYLESILKETYKEKKNGLEGLKEYIKKRTA